MFRAARRLCGLAVSLMGLALAACAPAGGKTSGTLHIYNWSDYIDPAILKDFTAETGIKVVYDVFDSNEVLETKVLQGETGYDLVVPSNHNLPRYITAGAVMALDKAKLPGLDRLSPDTVAHMAPFDPGGVYAVPYMQGTIGSATTGRPSLSVYPAWRSTAGTWCSSLRT